MCLILESLVSRLVPLLYGYNQFGSKMAVLCFPIGVESGQYWPKKGAHLETNLPGPKFFNLFHWSLIQNLCLQTCVTSPPIQWTDIECSFFLQFSTWLPPSMHQKTLPNMKSLTSKEPKNQLPSFRPLQKSWCRVKGFEVIIQHHTI